MQFKQMLRFTDRYEQHIRRKAEGTILALASRKIDLVPGNLQIKKSCGTLSFASEWTSNAARFWHMIA